MSGLAAVFERGGAAPGESIMDRLADALRPSGPEWSRTLVSGPAGFAYAHLTNTPEARSDSQPLHHVPSDTAFLFDGRLDNRSELVERLGMDPARASCLPDSELAQQCWQRWQEQALDFWIGDFAIIHWDGGKRQITAATDPFGRRCLSYRLTPKRLVIASLPKAVFAHPDVPRRLDQRKIAEAAGRMFVAQEESLFEGIARVPGGTVLTVGDRGDSLKRYYDIEKRIAPVSYRQDGDYVEAASELLTRSVKARLRSAGPVGSFLSGGLDSSSVAVEAADQLSRQGKRLETFTATPEDGWDGRTEPHAYGDERPYTADIASLRPDIRYNFVDCAGLALSSGARDFFAASDCIFPAYPNSHWYHAIGQAARAKGITTLLEGAFGNMTFSNRGEDVFIEMLRSGRIAALAREVSKRNAGSVRTNLRTILRHGADWALLARIPGGIHRLIRRSRGLRSANLLRSPVRSHALDSFGSVDRWEARTGRTLGAPYKTMKELWLLMLTHHFSAIAGELNQGFAALHGIELRDPFADRRIVEWSFGVPAEQFTRNGQMRWLVSRMMAARLPDSIIYKNKHIGRQAADWHLKFSRDLDEVRAALPRAQSHPILVDLFDFEQLKMLLDSWPKQTPVRLSDKVDEYRMLTTIHQIIMFVEMFEAQQCD